MKKILIYTGILVILISIFFVLNRHLRFDKFNLVFENKNISNKYNYDKNIKEITDQIKQYKIEFEKKKLQEYLDNLDLQTDSSLTKFVNNKVHFDDLAYIPKNLVKVSGKYIIDGKGGYIKVREILKTNLEKMAKDFFNDTKNNIIVVSGYRSYVYQKGIKDRGCPDNLCAKAGYSEHQSGLAIDIYSASSKENWTNNNNLKKYFFWLKNNAWKYGFTNSYQKGLEVDGYEIEPWHWRYVGVKLAKYLNDNKITFAEFYDRQKVRNLIK